MYLAGLTERQSNYRLSIRRLLELVLLITGFLLFFCTFLS
ncbi:hypothetical protein JCM19241_2705 [Vibrio ishigakensis]|uniref:Uncharacterized protein n=1 Tax=Vibrio ishigakensis TaxID=1481914 RepID=A0A0B8Q182_9VIBR|nr:hypothetical protein JCM19241_2705 [Vibrio ishigakensis]